jgi:L-2-hydroxyglutarate oxidase LhgO
MRIAATVVVNAAGLGAQAVARSIAGMPAAKIPPLYLAKGNYFSLSGRSPFSRLIYPMPTPGGLGVHLTLDLAGQAKFGPDVEWVDAIDYDVDPRRAASFYAAIRTYWPDLPDGGRQPGYAGIRPKIERPGGSSTDFLQRRRGLLRDPHKAQAQARRLSVRRRPASRSQPLPRRAQSAIAALHLDRRSRQNHRRRQARAPSVRFDPIEALVRVLRTRALRRRR